MQIKHIIDWGMERLTSSSSPRLDAEVLLCYILDKEASYLISHNTDEIGFWNLFKYKKLIKKRSRGVPVAYLMGKKEFFNLEILVNNSVLVPRQDTEILVDCVVEYIKDNWKIDIKVDPRVKPEDDKRTREDDIGECVLLDVGTGSGCIPVSILKNVDDLIGIALEISKKAMKIAKKNIKKHGLKNRIKLIHSNLLKNVDLSYLKSRNVVVTANLPYIPTEFDINPDLEFEPSIALYGGKDGLDIYKELMEELKMIKPKAIFLELFDFQIAILKEYMPDYELKFVKNMTGDARVMMMERIK